MTPPLPVFLTAGAERDLTALADWITAQRGQDAGDALLDRMLAWVETLEHFPDRGAVPPELELLGIRDFRQLVHPPWRMIYRVIDGAVYVLLIADGRRDFRRLLEQRLLGV
ncbi:MAG: plasmid stabilization protein [Sphingomonas sp.]|nr:plasmid stabilization protein [Sphingomonas sp.]